MPGRALPSPWAVAALRGALRRRAPAEGRGCPSGVVVGGEGELRRGCPRGTAPGGRWRCWGCSLPHKMSGWERRRLLGGKV